MEIRRTESIVTGGEETRIMVTCALHPSYKFKDGYWIDDIGCLDAPTHLPTGELIGVQFWSIGPQQRLKYRY